jgi:hypothetical protein
MARREDVPVARIELGRSCQAIAVHAFTAAELGVPLVEITGAREALQHLTIEQAVAFGNALLLAARIAAGETPPPTLFERFIGKRS